MRTLPKIIGACAIAALAASAAWASSAPARHRLIVWLPGGGTEQITYTGDVAPQVSIKPGDFRPESFWSPLALDRPMPIDRIAAAMDADMAAMLRQADAMMAMPIMAPTFNGVTEADLNATPPGSQSYSVVSTVNGNNVCTRSVEITQSGNGRPQVVRHASGNCAATPDNSVLFHMRPERTGPLTAIRSTMPEFVPAHPHI
jgi:hypothetical protein